MREPILGRDANGREEARQQAEEADRKARQMVQIAVKARSHFREHGLQLGENDG